MAEKPEKKEEKKEEKKFEKHGGKPAPQQGKPAHAAPHVPAAALAKTGGKEVQGIIRLAGKDLVGHFTIQRALSKVKGVGERLSAICAGIAAEKLKIPETAFIGELSEDQLNQLEELITHPVKYGVPTYLVNRRKDYDTGADIHLIGTDLTFSVKQDIERDKNINTWRGYRHAYGQKVRGQRTRSTGRTGMSVGVMRKAILAKAGAAAQAAAGAPAAAAASPAKKEVKKEEKK